MEKKQKNDDHDHARPDRLSELPDTLILEILSFLEMTDVVRTALLSKRWKGLWTTIHCLHFNESEKHADRSRNFFKQALNLWKGIQILKFKIILGHDMGNSLSGDKNFWVEFATARKVEELYLHSRPPSKRQYLLYDMRMGNRLPKINVLYRPPQCLYSCSSISKLTLIGCGLDVRENVRWDRLKSFTFHASYIDDDNLISHVVSGAPQLENFELYLLQCCGNVSIRSSSLKKLSIIKHFMNDKSLTIWAPNLEALVFSGGAHRECLLMDVSSLTDVTLDFTDTSTSEEVDVTLQQILPLILHVGAVTLSAHCIKMMIGVMEGISFNAKVVRVSAAPIELEPKHIVGRLGIFPMLKILIIDMNVYPNPYVGEPLDSDEYIDKSLLQLTTVEITWYSYEASMFQFIEFLLKRATMLERIVIKKGEAVGSEDMLLASQKIMSLQKSFPNVDMRLK